MADFGISGIIQSVSQSVSLSTALQPLWALAAFSVS
jgi:hypothetical protein